MMYYNSFHQHYNNAAKPNILHSLLVSNERTEQKKHRLALERRNDYMAHLQAKKEVDNERRRRLGLRLTSSVHSHPEIVLPDQSPIERYEDLVRKKKFEERRYRSMNGIDAIENPDLEILKKQAEALRQEQDELNRMISSLSTRLTGIRASRDGQENNERALSSPPLSRYKPRAAIIPVSRSVNSLHSGIPSQEEILLQDEKNQMKAQEDDEYRSDLRRQIREKKLQNVEDEERERLAEQKAFLEVLSQWEKEDIEELKKRQKQLQLKKRQEYIYKLHALEKSKTEAKRTLDIEVWRDALIPKEMQAQYMVATTSQGAIPEYARSAIPEYASSAIPEYARSTTPNVQEEEISDEEVHDDGVDILTVRRELSKEQSELQQKWNRQIQEAKDEFARNNSDFLYD